MIEFRDVTAGYGGREVLRAVDTVIGRGELVAIVGPNARQVLPLSLVWGAALLIYADVAARLLGEIPVGVVTAIIGAPFFLFLLRRTRTGYEL